MTSKEDRKVSRTKTTWIIGKLNSGKDIQNVEAPYLFNFFLKIAHEIFIMKVLAKPQSLLIKRVL